MPEFNWDAISAITEVVGVIVVVASLVYVGRQIAQNNQIMRVSAASETLEREFDLVYPVIDDPEFTEIWIKGNDRFKDLSEVEQHRLLFFERRAIVLWHHNYHLRQQGIYPDENWRHQNWIIQNIGRRQSVREAWRQFKGSHEPTFQAYVDDQLDAVSNN